MSGKELVEVFHTNDKLVELQIVCAELKRNDISFMVKGESAGDIYGIITDGLAEKKIFVNEEDFARAKEIIEEALKGRG